MKYGTDELFLGLDERLVGLRVEAPEAVLQLIGRIIPAT